MPQPALAENPVLSNKLVKFIKTSDKVDVFFYSSDDMKDVMAELTKEDESAPCKKNNLYPRPEKSNFSGLSCYYRSLTKFPPFEREEEEEIFRTYTRLKRRIKRIKKVVAMQDKVIVLERKLLKTRNEIVERNLKFVIKLAKSFWMDKNPENFENLVSAGNIGLIRAIDRFDPNKGVRFLTYAANWIALEIRMELANSNLIYIPIWWQKILKKLISAYNQLSIYGDKVPVADLAKRADVSERHIRKLCNNTDEVSQDQLPLLRAEVPFCEKTHMSTIPTAEDLIIHKNASQKISHALSKIKPNERLVINSVYGLDSRVPQNLRQVSNIMGNTGERVRQLRVKGVASMKKKLASPTELGGLGINELKDII